MGYLKSSTSLHSLLIAPLFSVSFLFSNLNAQDQSSYENSFSKKEYLQEGVTDSISQQDSLCDCKYNSKFLDLVSKNGYEFADKKYRFKVRSFQDTLKSYVVYLDSTALDNPKDNFLLCKLSWFQHREFYIDVDGDGCIDSYINKISRGKFEYLQPDSAKHQQEFKQLQQELVEGFATKYILR